MKYQIVATNPNEEQALQSGNVPLPVLDTFLPVVQARAIMAAVHLGIVAAFGHDTRTAKELAHSLSLDSECLELLLRVLQCAGYVTSHRNQYRLTELAENTLLADSPSRLSTFVEWSYFQWGWIEHLEEVVRTGEGVDAHQTLGPSPNWAVYQRAMMEMAQTMAPAVASLVPIKADAQKLLDIGGSHGLYGAMISRQHPPMRSEVFDLPQAVEHARELAREIGIDDIVTHRAGNALEDDFGRDFDAVFVADTIHHFTRDQNQDIFRRARNALTPGGTVAIWDFERPDPEAEPELTGDALALFFRLTSTAQCYTSADYVGWLESAGFVDLKAHPAPFAPGHILVTGRAR
jgi:SAM-dependent methyltransferase